MSSENGTLSIAPGWYAALLGEECDLRTWSRELAASAEAQVLEAPLSQWFLSSLRFAECADHHAVRGLAHALVDELNIRMAGLHATLPLHVGTVDQVHPGGGRHSYHSGYVSLRSSGDAQPMRGLSKKHLRALPLHERVRGLLVQLANADDWPAIYGTLELAEQLVGSQDRMRKLSGEPERYRRLRSWANGFRHQALNNEVSAAISIAEAQPLLRSIVRIALRNRI